jgi:WhiB family redox-sensing transcriptional regulator
MKLTRQQAFVEFCHAQAELEDRGETLPCRLDPEFFYPEDYFEPATRRISEAVAKQLCSSCPLEALCASYAVLSQEDYGIWGGTNAKERRERRLSLREK